MNADRPKPEPHVTGWLEALNEGRTMAVEGPDRIAVKIVATAEGIFVIALGDDRRLVGKVLERLSLPQAVVKNMLCG